MAAGFILAHDIGTYSCKTVLLDLERGVVARAQRSYSPRISAGRAEQPPEEWWAAVCAASRQALATADARPASVRAVVFAGQMLGIVPLGREALGPAILWLDARAQAEATALTRLLGGRAMARLLFGAAPSAKDVVPKLLWMRRHDAARLERARWLLDVPGYLAWRASGVAAIDRSGASATGLLGRRGLTWSSVLARLLGVPLALLPPVATPGVRIGGVLPGAAGELGLPAGTPVLCGAGDVVCAALGCGAAEPGAAHVYLGTSGWIALLARRPARAAPSIAGPRHGDVVRVLHSEAAGACLDWIARLLCGSAGEQELAHIETLAQQAAPGAGDVLFWPWLWGERAPLDDAQARAAFAGLSAGAGRAQLVRAVYEGVALNNRWSVEQLRAAGPLPLRLRVGGGAARSDALLQIIADVCGLQLERVAQPRDAVALGAARLAGAGLGLAPPGELVRVERVFSPRPADAAAYQAVYRRFREARA